MRLLTTSRLFLDLATKKDASFLFDLMNDPTYIKNIGDRNIKTIADAENFINDKFIKSYEDNGYGYYIIKLKDHQKPIGICGLVNRKEMKFIDIGYALLPEFTNKGFALEATKALYDYARSTLKINDIVAIINPDNYKSITLIEKLGMKYKKKIQLPDDNIECYLFSNRKNNTKPIHKK
ncbi:GNAT family N-acetyltransferase [Aureibaculum sp. 2210JD6-5]|uniref:GNAT family N-acetyltransferase n=1 Tax=Aureibaculum sp. 2210JD6-5 TaxID=3103957 RepID=UPI002AAED5D7|nr:GNAT family N-acetyltransferase [Aureibaculum sp. 2210JD6-5]MDY7395889.1 GNAT family N-acetyltransferase [Aureibaculum sp. 2210JD6-5]